MRASVAAVGMALEVAAGARCQRHCVLRLCLLIRLRPLAILSPSPQLSVSDFSTATSPEALQNAVDTAVVPGTLTTGGTEEPKKSKAVAIGVGVGVGVGVPLVAAAGFAYWRFVWKPAQGTSALKTPLSA